MARVAVNGVHLNVEVWPSSPSPPAPLSLSVGEGESPVEVAASVSSPDVQREGLGGGVAGLNTAGRLSSPAHGRAGWAAGSAEPGDQSAWDGGEGLLLLHGFTGGVDAWRSHRPVLARRGAVVAVDLIGHGDSDAPDDPARYSMDRCVEDLLTLLDHLGIPRVAVLGYSMGARVALRLAVAAPGRVAALILESGSPGLATQGERQARRAANEALAERIEREGVERFVDYWESIPLFATQQRLPSAVREGQRRQRLRNNALGLANSLRGMGTGAQESLWDSLEAVTAPTLLMAGALDEKFRAIGRAMAAVMPDARLAIVPDAGHAVHLEQPGEFGQVVAGFLGRSATDVAWQTTATDVASEPATTASVSR